MVDFRKAISEEYKIDEVKDYDRTISIINSSGTGKSKLVHELSKKVLRYPVILDLPSK